MRSVRKIFALAAISLLLAGCAPHYDDVLWRPVVLPYKDLIAHSLAAPSDLTSSEVAGQILNNTSAMPSQYWDGESDPEGFGLEHGGLVVWDVVDQGGSIQFDGLISSGPRDAESDPPIHDSPYFGPSAIYTCFTVIADAPMEQYEGSFGYEELPCPAELVETLDPHAMSAPIGEFKG